MIPTALQVGSALGNVDISVIQYEIAGVGGMVGVLLGISWRNMALLNRIKSYLQNQLGARLD